MNTKIYLKDKTVNQNIPWIKTFPGGKKKKQKLGVNVVERYAKNVTKTNMVLVWASINGNKYIIFCYLETLLLCYAI